MCEFFFFSLHLHFRFLAMGRRQTVSMLMESTSWSTWTATPREHAMSCLPSGLPQFRWGPCRCWTWLCATTAFESCFYHCQQGRSFSWVCLCLVLSFCGLLSYFSPTNRTWKLHVQIVFTPSPIPITKFCLGGGRYLNHHVHLFVCPAVHIFLSGGYFLNYLIICDQT